VPFLHYFGAIVPFDFLTRSESLANRLGSIARNHVYETFEIQSVFPMNN